MAGRGLRVLGVAFRTSASVPPGATAGELEEGLAFLGLVGMTDPPRPEASPAVRTCRAAGIRPMMITGDHPSTAVAVARSLGIGMGDAVVTGAELSRMTPGEISAVVRRTDVYARVSPGDKLAIVTALQADGHVVAMTGDGVNDAPALRKADIGVAMGCGGTDVAREAGDMILTDDNFATIVAAVGEGRVIYDNVRKFILYILASNAGEILVMLLGPLLGMPIPLLPLQILWINLLTDGLPALALGVEPPEGDAMRRPPRSPEEGVLTRGTRAYVLRVGTLLGSVCLAVAIPLFRGGGPVVADRPVHHPHLRPDGACHSDPFHARDDLPPRSLHEPPASARRCRHRAPAAGGGLRPAAAEDLPHGSPSPWHARAVPRSERSVLLRPRGRKIRRRYCPRTFARIELVSRPPSAGNFHVCRKGVPL